MLSEQQEIVAYLDAYCEKVDAIVMGKIPGGEIKDDPEGGTLSNYLIFK